MKKMFRAIPYVPIPRHERNFFNRPVARLGQLADCHSLKKRSSIRSTAKRRSRNARAEAISKLA